MNPLSLNGRLGVAAASVLGGWALAPMKYQHGWRFEHTWLDFSVHAYLIFPWLVALVTVPNLLDVYRDVGPKPTLLTAFFGLGWGLAVVLNGYAVTLVGLAVTAGLLMGSSIAVGSLVALLQVDPERLLATYGAKLFLVNLGIMIGVYFCARAAVERENLNRGPGTDRRSSSSSQGVIICLLAGLLSTLFNVALTYGQIISRQAEVLRASASTASNAAWAVAVSAGSIPSIVWCLFTLSRSGGWRDFHKGTKALNAMRCLMMAVMWISGTVLYGSSARLGPHWVGRLTCRA